MNRETGAPPLMGALLFFVSSILCAWKILWLLTLHGDVQLLTRYSHGCNGLLPLTSIYEKESCMNYTENCHLPQWEEQDRVLRTDFNNAFAALEVIGADHARVRAVEDALIRDAYRREVRGRVCHGPYGALDGMWVNALTTREDAGGDGHGWNGKYGVSLGGGYLPTVEGIKESKKEISEISTIGEAANRNYQAAAEFVSNGYGTMTALSCYFNRWYNSKENLTITIRLLRLDTNQQVAEAGPLTSGPDLYTTFPVNFPMEANIPYRLEFDYPEDAQFTGLAGFCFASEHYTGATWMTFAPRQAAGTITQKINAPEGTKGAIALLRWSGGGAASLEFNKTKPEPVRSRETVNACGEACTETEYLIDPLPAGTLSIVLRMKQSGEPLKVFDYGLIWQ